MYIIPIFTASLLPHSPTPPIKIRVENFLRFGISTWLFQLASGGGTTLSVPTAEARVQQLIIDN